MAYEKVNPSHVDKLADRIGGAIVDLSYRKQCNPRVAVEVLIGHGYCYIINETSVPLILEEVTNIVHRIAGGGIRVEYIERPQDAILAENQSKEFRCGDNGVFKGMPVTEEQKTLTSLAKAIYKRYPYDGKYLIDKDRVIICQSNANSEDLLKFWTTAEVNPLGDWTGGYAVDSGATNRKLGSDMGDSVTGSGINGKDLSKADVSVNIYAWLKAQETGRPVEITCAIGDRMVDGRPYSEIVEIARDYIESVGGFEKFAEWGLIR